MRRLALLLAVMWATAGVAQTAGSELASTLTDAQTVEPAKAARQMSPHVAGLLAAATTQFTLPKVTEKKPAPSTTVSDQPANEIVRLPQVTVRAVRVPTTEDIRTPRGLEVYAMNKYLGRPDGFSRAVLNRFTIADMWKHVPILGRYPWFSSPERTALAMYYDDEVRKKLADLMALQATAGRSASSAPAGK